MSDRREQFQSPASPAQYWRGDAPLAPSEMTDFHRPPSGNPADEFEFVRHVPIVRFEQAAWNLHVLRRVGLRIIGLILMSMFLLVRPSPAFALPDPKKPAPLEEVRLEMDWDAEGLKARSQNPVPLTQFLMLEESGDLRQWSETARFQGDFLYRLPGVEGKSSAFYRVRSTAATEDHDWKNQIHFPDDPFRNKESDFGNGPARWVKFIILLGGEPEVVFQDSEKYAFHYDFASVRLEAFQGVSAEEFNDATLYPGPRQKAVVGAVVLPPDNPAGTGPVASEIGIQFAGGEPFPIEDVIEWFNLARAAVYSETPVQAYYMPSYEQTARAIEHSAALQNAGIELSDGSRWANSNSIYSEGWAFGRLVFVEGSEIMSAYASGDLTGSDILITDGVPAELPPLAGIISLSPSTPNSHVAILARSYGVPFIHLISEEDQDEAMSWVDGEIYISATKNFGGNDVELFAVDSASIQESTRAALLAAQLPPPLDYLPKAGPGQWSASTKELHPSDIQFYGGKAANFGVLRRSIPNHSPEAVAFSFDLWDVFMTAETELGVSLKEWIAFRLAPYMVERPQILGMQIALDDVRETIEDVEFPSELKPVVIEALGSFDAEQKIRFRSSTNLEDSETFTGAGLYDSYSGCLQDDLDSDEDGPSICDASDARERGVFRAIKKVFASFYNDNAFLERRRRLVSEDEAGMALLVHHSFPDEIEWANGVASVYVSAGANFSSIQGELVTQLGALSMSNPEPGSIPEVVDTRQFNTENTIVDLRASSSSLPLGDTVMDWRKDYIDLTSLIKTAGIAYLNEFPDKDEVLLDFEYKKVEPGELTVKQIREIPNDQNNTPSEYILLDRSIAWTVHQGEHADLFATHRLKSDWRFTVKNGELWGIGADSSYYESLEMNWNRDGQSHSIDSRVVELPDYQFEIGGESVFDRWTLQTEEGALTNTLTTTLSLFRLPQNAPVVTEDRFDIRWKVDYEQPKPAHDFNRASTTLTDEVILKPAQPVDDRSLLQTRTFELPKDVVITTTFYWPAPPTGPTAGYTAPLIGWVETVIEGLTEEALVLKSPFAQTYVPEHHNFAEDFLFEPRRDEGVSEGQLTELEQADIQAILVHWGEANLPTKILGLDGRFRDL